MNTPTTKATLTYRWDQEEHEPLCGNHTESPSAITVVLTPAMQERIETSRAALVELSAPTDPFDEGGVMSLMIRFSAFELEGYEGKTRHGLLEVSRTWVYLNFYNEWTGEQYELPLTDDLLVQTPAQEI